MPQDSKLFEDKEKCREQQAQAFELLKMIQELWSSVVGLKTSIAKNEERMSRLEEGHKVFTAAQEGIKNKIDENTATMEAYNKKVETLVLGPLDKLTMWKNRILWVCTIAFIITATAGTTGITVDQLIKILK